MTQVTARIVATTLIANVQMLMAFTPTIVNCSNVATDTGKTSENKTDR